MLINKFKRNIHLYVASLILLLMLAILISFFSRNPFSFENSEIMLKDQGYFTCIEKRDILQAYLNHTDYDFFQAKKFSESCYDAEVYLANRLIDDNQFTLSHILLDEMVSNYPNNIYVYYLLINNLFQVNVGYDFEFYCSKYSKLLKYVNKSKLSLYSVPACKK